MVTIAYISPYLSVLQGTLRSKLPVLMLMGNKCDQCTERRVSREEGQKMALVSSICLGYYSSALLLFIPWLL